MRDYSLAHLSDERLLRDLAELMKRERAATVDVLVHIAEVDARKLFAVAGYASMHAYCVGELRLSEDAAFKRIRAARAGRRFQVLFAALAEGRIHLAGAYLLASHLTDENVHELLALATHRRRSEVEELVMARFPGPEGSKSGRPVASIRPCRQVRSDSQGDHKTGHSTTDPAVELGQLAWAPAGSGAETPARASEDKKSEEADGMLVDADGMLVDAAGTRTSPLETEQLAPGPVQMATPVALPCVTSYLVRLTIGKSFHDKLRHAQALLSHSVPPGDVAQILERGLDSLIAETEKRKLGSRTRRSSKRAPAAGSRYIPKRVRRAVWERDQGQCTFVGDTGHRCGSKDLLQLDHVEPHARRPNATVDNLRLRCRTHNQLEAERIFGNEFMNRKRKRASLVSRVTSRASDRELPLEPAAPQSG